MLMAAVAYGGVAYNTSVWPRGDSVIIQYVIWGICAAAILGILYKEIRK